VTRWLHPAAEAELSEAAIYYTRNASLRIAEALLLEFERAVERITSNQGLGRKVEGDLRIHSLQRFPYSLIYREAESGPRIYAVAHKRREPGYWKNCS
jgi:toxin ParE1/3/4